MSIINTILSKSILIKDIEQNPELIFNYLNFEWIRAKRWFVDKDAEILNIICEDYFMFECESNLSIINGIILIDLRSTDGLVYTKRYFIPLILSEESAEISAENECEKLEISFKDGKRVLFPAEHHIEYQRELIKHFQKGEVINTRNKARINFNSEGDIFTKLNISTLEVKTLNVSTSNVLTCLCANSHSFISKTYKDMRGNIKESNKIWPINLESERYKVLMDAGFENIAAVHGISYYENSDGYKMPISMLMDYVQNDGELGGVFWNLLTEKLENSSFESNSFFRSIEMFCEKVASSVACMHTSFSMSNKNEFKVVSVTQQDIQKMCSMTLDGIYKNINTLKLKIGYGNNLQILTEKLEKSFLEFKDSNFFDDLNLMLEEMMKIQIHGDLSTAQALICYQNDNSSISALLEQIKNFDEKAVENTIEKLIQKVVWVDFEGEPSKNMVEKDYDSRQSALRDVASLIEGFWYALNVKVFMHLGFNTEKEPQHKDSVREISLVLSENLSTQEVSIEGLSLKLVGFIKQCFERIKESIINGYFDEIERQEKQNIVLKNWDKENAKKLIDYFILLRAIHELSYESYARDWGWEAIPGGMIIRIIRNMTSLSSACGLSNYGLQVVPESLINEDKGFLPVYAGIAQSGLFLPFHHDHSKTQDLSSERYHWGIGDFASAKEGIDLISELGFNIRQILPITWSAAFHSPYSVLSPEALDPEYIGIPALFNMLEKNGIKVDKARDFVEDKKELIEQLRNNNIIDHHTISNFKLHVMELVWEAFKNYEDSDINAEFQEYRNSMTEELKDDLLYYILKEENMKRDFDIGWDWRTWNKFIPGISERSPEALIFARNKYQTRIVFLEFVQFVLHLQWDAITKYAKEKGVDFMIDMPFAPADARVWSNPNIVVMSPKSEGYQRTEVQGVPGKKETPLGQIWQFPVYDFSNSDAIKYLLDVFNVNLKRAKYIRCDHTLGFYRVFVFHQDIEQKITLQSLGIYEDIENIRKQALEEGTDHARKRAAYKVCDVIKNALLYPKEDMPKLPDEVSELLFENGDLRANGGNMLIVARKVEDMSKPNNVYWHREHLVESKVFKNQPCWDFLRLTLNKRADDEGFAQKWLFPEDNTPGPLVTDGIHVAYYKPGPAEGILTDFERLCQQAGALLGHELLGYVPDELQISIKTKIGGMDLNPKVWGLNRWSRYHPLKDDANSISVFGVADSTSVANAWMDFDNKEELLKEFGIDFQNCSKHLENLTPEVHEKLLKMAFVPQDIYPEMEDECMPLISILGLIDLAGLDDTYRLNFPSTQSSWYMKLPKEASTGELLYAVRGQSDNQRAVEIVELAKKLIEARNKRKRKISDEVKVLGIRPSQDVQIRRIDREKPQNTFPFLIDAYIQGNAEGVFLSLIDENDNEVCEIPMKELEIKQYDNISRWSLALLPTVRRIYKYKVKVLTKGSVLWSKIKFLATVDKDDVLNPLLPNYAFEDLTKRIISEK